MHELAVQLRDDLGVLEDDLGHERARLQVATALELEQVALGAQDRALRQALQQPSSVRRVELVGHATTVPAAGATSHDVCDVLP